LSNIFKVTKVFPTGVSNKQQNCQQDMKQSMPNGQSDWD